VRVDGRAADEPTNRRDLGVCRSEATLLVRDSARQSAPDFERFRAVRQRFERAHVQRKRLLVGVVGRLRIPVAVLDPPNNGGLIARNWRVRHSLRHSRAGEIRAQTTKVEGQVVALAERVSRRLGNDGALTVQQAAPATRHQLDTTAAKLWAHGPVTVGALWRLYAEYPYMPRLRDRAVLDAGLTGPQLLWEQEGFALADGYDEAGSKYRAMVLPTDGMTVAVSDATLIVRPERARAQRALDLAAVRTASGPQSSAGPESSSSSESDPGPKPPGRTRFFGSKRLQADRYASDFKKLVDEVLGPLATTPGVTVNVTIEIEATTTDGFDDAKVRTVSENAATLKFEQSGFEET